jgi:hypothetical protein
VIGSGKGATCIDAGSVPVQTIAPESVRRDLRLDASRGLALWFIFLDHIPDNVVASR